MVNNSVVLVVSGSRVAKDYEKFKENMEKLIKEATVTGFLYGKKVERILVGDCKGIDELCLRWCRERKISVDVFKADWKNEGLKAGPMRNKKMVEKGDMLFAFPACGSRGTKNTIELARKKDIPVFIQQLS